MDGQKGVAWGGLEIALQHQVLSLSHLGCKLSPFLIHCNPKALISDTHVSGRWGSVWVLVTAVTMTSERSREQGQRVSLLDLVIAETFVGSCLYS